MSGGPKVAWLSRRQWRYVKWASGGVTLAIALLSLLATMENEALAGNGNPWVEVLRRPWPRIKNSPPEPVSLSRLLGEADPQPETVAPLYVFMLDVSKSMRNGELSKEEYERFLMRATGEAAEEDPVWPPASRACRGARPSVTTRLTSFDVAVIELCRYVMALPEGSRAALWTFGAAAQRLVPGPADASRSVPIKLIDDTDGRVTLRAALSSLDASDLQTDFESALGTILDSYRAELNRGNEIHVVLISDFVHDLGLGRASVDEQANLPVVDRRGFLERQYAASMRMIQRRFRTLNRAGAMFHFAAVVGTQRVSRSELALAGDSLEWRSYRIIQHGEVPEAEFDFLRGYRTASEPLVFGYEPGADSVDRLELRIDTFASGTGKAKVWIAGPGEGDCQLKLGFESWLQPAPGTSALSGSPLGRVPTLTNRSEPELVHGIGPGHTVGFKPVWPLTPFDAAKCALLVAVQEQGTPGVFTASTTAILPIVFKRRLSLFGAVGMALGNVTAGVSVLTLLGIPGLVAARRGSRRVKALYGDAKARWRARAPASASPAVEAPDRTAPTEGTS